MVAGHTTTSTFIVENVNMLSGGISWFPYKALIIWITMWFYIHTTTGLKSHSSSTIRCHILWFSMAMAKAKVLSWARGSWNVSGEKNRVDGSFGVVKITMRLGVSWYKIYIDIPETRCIHAYVYDLYFNDTRIYCKGGPPWCRVCHIITWNNPKKGETLHHQGTIPVNL